MNLVERLKALLDRLELIARGARQITDEARLVSRLGISAAETLSMSAEIASKAEEQMGVCGQAITELLVNRAFPLMFRSGVKRAERFADECDYALSQIQESMAAGKSLAKSRFGTNS